MSLRDSGVAVKPHPRVSTAGSPNVKSPPELALKSLEAALSVCRVTSASLPVFTSSVLTAVKDLTAASWAELLLVEGDNLVVCPSGEDSKYTMKQIHQRFRITEYSLAGLTVLSGETKNFTAPQTSLFYKNSTNKLTPFSPRTFQPEETWSIAAVPICDSFGTRSGVLVLFNKAEERITQGFFTATDLSLCKEICAITGSIIETRQAMKVTQDQLTRLQQAVTQRVGLTDLFLHLYEKKKRLKQFLKTLRDNTQELTFEIVEVLASILEVDAVLVHTVQQEKVEPQIVYGLHLDDYHTKSAVYCGLTMKEALHIRDISTEPLFSHFKIGMKSALCCPLVHGQSCVAVFEFFRETAGFSELDMTLARKTLSGLEHISIKAYERRFPGLVAPNSESRAVHSFLHYLSDFSLPRKDETFDYARLLNAAEAALKQTFHSSLCSIYICDDTRNFLWTRKSDSSDPLTFIRDEDSLLGYLSHIPTPTRFPLTGDLLNKEGALLYARATGVCVPIITNLRRKEHVIGIILITRTDPFEDEEIKDMGLYLQILSRSLMILLIDNSFKSYQCGSSSGFIRSASFREVNIEETVLERERTEGKVYKFSNEEARKSAPLIRLVPDLLVLPNDTLTTIANLCTRLEQIDDPYKAVAQELVTLLPSEAARLLMYDNYRKTLIDKETGVQYVPSGLVNACLSSKLPLILTENVDTNSDFNHQIDGLGLEEVTSLAIIPILCFGNQVIGVLIFGNLKQSWSPASLATAKLLACIPRDILIAKDDTVLNWRNLAQTGRRQQMMFKWCGEVFRVLVLSQERTLKCSSILNRLHRSPELADLLAISLETLTLILNAEKVKLVIKRPGTSVYLSFTLESGLEILSPALDQFAQEVFHKGTTVMTGSQSSWENAMVLPVSLNRETVAVLEVINKKDEVQSAFVDFESTDEAVVKDICNELGAPCQALVTPTTTPQSFPELAAVLKERAWAINNYTLLSLIRRACKTLLDCDRASVFLVEGDKLVIRPQGNDSEVPVGLSIPITMGVVGSVVRTKKTVNIEDAYQDSRFTPSVDMKTGYRTRTMLCVPVIAQGQVIAVLQMINKANGLFDSMDTELLEVCSQLAAGALQSMHLFQALTDEKKRYTDILNSLGCVIVVLNEGKLDFSNRAIGELLGVSEPFALTHHYSLWTSLSTAFRNDIESVHEGRVRKVRRKFQKLLENDSEDRRFDYRVIPLDEEDSIRKKLLLVFEETGIKVATQSVPSKPMIQSETKLHMCIHQLTEVMEKADSELKSSLEFVVNTLKSGDLNHAKIVVEEESLTRSLDPEILQLSPVLLQSQVLYRKTSSGLYLDVQEVPHKYVDLAELRNWNLDLTLVSSEYPYILGMLQDFSLISTFEIDLGALQNFLSEIKTCYNHRHNPFHNYHHGCAVMHCIYCLLTSTAAGALFENWELLSLLVGALCHDVDHTGRSNSFETMKESVLAIRYHDKSVLEQHHAAMLFLTLQKSGCNFLCNFDINLKKQFRKFVVTIILATDMARHMTIVSNMQARFKELAEDPLGSRPNDRQEAAELMIHSADLSNPTKTFEMSFKWSSLLAKEFEAQVNEEREMGFPLTTFMVDLNKPSVFLKNEIGFYSFIVLPLWECLREWLTPGLDTPLSQLSSNIEKLKLMQKQADSGPY